MIRSFKIRGEQIFRDGGPQSFPKRCNGGFEKAENVKCAENLNDLRFRQLTDWRNSREIGLGSTV